MTPTSLKYIFVAASCIVALVPNQIAAQPHQPQHREPVQYYVINLGTPLGGTSAVATGVSNKGWVDGAANLPGDHNQHAVIWAHRRVIDLGTLGGPNSFTSARPNESGVVVVEAETGTADPLGEDFCGFGTHLTCLGFFWHDGMRTLLPTLGGNNIQPGGNNDLGQVAGFSETAAHDPTCVAPQVLNFQAVIWGPAKGEMHQLPPFAGDSGGAAFGINNLGDVVGASGQCGNVSPATAYHAVLWRHGSPIDLGNLGGAVNNVALANNNRGDVVGFSDVHGDTTFHAFLWRHGAMRDLGTLPGDPLSQASANNDAGQVVGQSCDAIGNCRAFLWENGAMTDLNALVAPDCPLYLMFAHDIGSRGEIVGIAYDKRSGKTPAFLAIPIHESAARFGAVAVPRAVLPERVRMMMLQRRRFNRFGFSESQPRRP